MCVWVCGCECGCGWVGGCLVFQVLFFLSPCFLPPCSCIGVHSFCFSVLFLCVGELCWICRRVVRLFCLGDLVSSLTSPVSYSFSELSA